MVKCFHLGVGWGLAAALCAAPPPAAPARKVTTVVRPDARTGRLIRAVAVSPRLVAPAVVAQAEPDKRPEPAATPSRASLREAVEQVALQNALPVQLMHSVIKVESNYNPLAISPKGAMGLMQLVPATARRFGVSDVFNPLENLRGGARYLRYLLDLYGENNYHLALAAYNAGEGAVARYGGVPPYVETRNYLALVGQARDDASRHGAPAADPQPAGSGHQTVEGKPVEVQNHIREVVEPDGRIRYVSH
jgi:soluble lytic murein transglycosylase-like protein